MKLIILTVKTIEKDNRKFNVITFLNPKTKETGTFFAPVNAPIKTLPPEQFDKLIEKMPLLDVEFNHKGRATF